MLKSGKEFIKSTINKELGVSKSTSFITDRLEHYSVEDRKESPLCLPVDLLQSFLNINAKARDEQQHK
jgi:hypothetical protein